MNKFTKVMTRDTSLIAVEVWSSSHSKLLPAFFRVKWPAPIFIFRGHAVESWRSESFHSGLPCKIEVWLRSKRNQKKLLDKCQEYFTAAKKLRILKAKNKRKKVLKDVVQVCDLLSKGLVGLIAFYWSYEWNQNPGIEVPSAILKIGKRARGSDTLFDDANEILFRYLKILARKHGWSAGSEALLLIKELEKALANPQGFPSREIRIRRKGYFYYRSKIWPLDSLDGFLRARGFKLTEEKAKKDVIIKGLSAYRGLVRGAVKIVYNRNEIDKVRKGDILVAPMTTPWYLPAMRKATAFVTDEGGIICHAAIIAREMKKPCVIGTKIATKVLKDGDLVEVDAKRGVVRKLDK